MSGTSLDGVDLCFSNFSYENKDWKFLIRDTETLPYEKSWITKLTNAPSLSENELDKLDLEFTSYLSKIILVFIQKTKLVTSILFLVMDILFFMNHKNK